MIVPMDPERRPPGVDQLAEVGGEGTVVGGAVVVAGAVFDGGSYRHEFGEVLAPFVAVHLQADADDNKAIADAVKRVRERIEAFEKFPTTDLFDDFK